MFDKLKQLNELRKMKNAIQAETATEEKNGVKIIINGGFNIEDLTIAPEAMNGDLSDNVKKCFNDALGKMQMILAQKFSGMVGQ